MSLVGNDDSSVCSSSSVTFETGNIPAGKSNRFHAIHAIPAMGTFWKKKYSCKKLSKIDLYKYSSTKEIYDRFIFIYLEELKYLPFSAQALKKREIKEGRSRLRSFSQYSLEPACVFVRHHQKAWRSCQKRLFWIGHEKHNRHHFYEKLTIIQGIWSNISKYLRYILSFVNKEFNGFKTKEITHFGSQFMMKLNWSIPSIDESIRLP